MKVEIDAFALIVGGVFYMVCKFVAHRLSSRRATDSVEKGGSTQCFRHFQTCVADAVHKFSSQTTKGVVDSVPEIEAAEPEAESAPENAMMERTANFMSVNRLVICVFACLSGALLIANVPRLPSSNENAAHEGEDELEPLIGQTARVEEAKMVQHEMSTSSEPFQVLANPRIRIPLTRHKTIEEEVDNSIVEYRSAYYGTLNVGSSMDGYTFIFDTGSGYLIVPSMYCHSATCKSRKRYKRSVSVTAIDIDGNGGPIDPNGGRETMTIEFGSGHVAGVFTDDAVCVGRTEPIRKHQASTETLPTGCTRMRFITTTEMSESPFAAFPFDGILGLGMPSLSKTREFSFIHALSKQMQMPTVFGLFLASDSAGTSELSIGGWDPKHVDLNGEHDLTWFPVVHEEMGHWLLKVKSLRVDNESIDFCSDDCYVVVDSGTALLSVPTLAFRTIFAQLWHTPGLDGECKQFGPQLHFDMEGDKDFTVSMNSEDYARPQVSTTTGASPTYGPTILSDMAARRDYFCRPMLMAMDMPAPVPSKLFILGEPALREYYTAYDAESKRVGFALARHPLPAASFAVVPAADKDQDEDAWFFD